MSQQRNQLVVFKQTKKS